MSKAVQNLFQDICNFLEQQNGLLIFNKQPVAYNNIEGLENEFLQQLFLSDGRILVRSTPNEVTITSTTYDNVVTKFIVYDNIEKFKICYGKDKNAYHDCYCLDSFKQAFKSYANNKFVMTNDIKYSANGCLYAWMKRIRHLAKVSDDIATAERIRQNKIYLSQHNVF